MRETRFIEQNAQSWRDCEEDLHTGMGDPERLREHFTRVTEDFSYARTFYPNRMVRLYLNGLAQSFFQKLKARRRVSWGRFWRFWSHEIPQLVWESRGSMLAALGIFLLAMLVGVVSCRIDPEFPRRILGDSYVDMTIENIESGDPMKVYKERGALGMSLGIAANNLFVAALTFTFGAFWGLGTVFFLLFNGVMVGAFQYFFIEKGVGLESFLGIWTHGALEISSIVIAGAAGLELARGPLFPGTLTRGQAFRLSANRGLKIFVSIAPLFLLAAFFEGFLTRHTELPNLMRGAFIGICFLFIGAYYIWLPWARARRGEFKEPLAMPSLNPTRIEPLVFDRLRTSGEVLADSFFLFKKHGAMLARAIVLSTTTTWAFMWLAFDGGERSEMFQSSSWALGLWASPAAFFVNANIPWLWAFQGAVLAVLTFLSFKILEKEKVEEAEKPTSPALSLVSAAAVMLPFSWMFGNLPQSFLLTIFLFGLAVAAVFIEGRNPLSAFTRGLGLTAGDFWKGALLNLMWSLVGLMCYLFASSLVFQYVFKLVLWNLSIPSEKAGLWEEQFGAACSLAILYGIFVLAMLGSGLLFHALREIREATSLWGKVAEIGTGRAIRGLERE